MRYRKFEDNKIIHEIQKYWKDDILDMIHD